MATFPRHIPTTDRILAPRSERGTATPHFDTIPTTGRAGRVPTIGIDSGHMPGTRPDLRDYQ